MMWPIRRDKDATHAEIRSVLVGRHRPPGGASRDPKEHAVGFGTALQLALDGAKPLLFPKQDLGKAGTTFDVSIRFEATINVRNPGAIDEYRAVVTGP